MKNLKKSKVLLLTFIILILFSTFVFAEENVELKLAKTLTNPYISTLLLTIGFIGMVIKYLLLFDWGNH